MVDSRPTNTVEVVVKALRELPFEQHAAADLEEGASPPTRRDRTPAVELNVVPLVDVLFLLMVFFVIGGAGGILEGILASRMARTPGSSGGTAAGDIPIPSTPIVVEVKAIKPQSWVSNVRFGTLRYEARSETQLAAELKRMIVMPGLSAQTSVVIATDEEVLWDDVARVWNAILYAGFRDVAFQQPSGQSTGRVQTTP